MESETKIGRPLKYQTVEELNQAIDDYFRTTSEDRWTWTGLALHLDTSRETLREYKLRPEFVDSLKRALLMIENGYEIDMKQNGRAGSIFALKNFGWHDKNETDITTGGEQIQPASLPPELITGFTDWLAQSTKQ